MHDTLPRPEDAPRQRCAALISAALRLLAVGALCLFATQPRAQSATIYGILDVGVDVSDMGTAYRSRVISGGLSGSRLGYFGSQDLGGGLSAEFRLESGMRLDTGALAQGGRMFGREASVGLSEVTFGTIKLGRLPTPYWSTLDEVDAFRRGLNGSPGAVSRSGDTARQLLPLAVTPRADNAINYTSANWRGFSLDALIAAGESSSAVGNTQSLALRHSNGPFVLVAGWAEQQAPQSGEGRLRGLVLGGRYDFGPVEVLLGYTDERNTCMSCIGRQERVAGVAPDGDSAFRVANLGVRIPIGRTLLMAQYTRIIDRTDYAVPTGSRDSDLIAVGAEYRLSARTTLYGGVGTIENRNGSAYVLGTGSVQQLPDFLPSEDARVTTLSLGVRHSF